MGQAHIMYTYVNGNEESFFRECSREEAELEFVGALTKKEWIQFIDDMDRKITIQSKNVIKVTFAYLED